MHLDAVKNFKQALDQMVADNEVTAAYANQLIRLMRAGLNQYAAAAGFGGSFDYVATGSGRPMRSRFDVERERSNATPLAFTNVQKKSDAAPAAAELAHAGLPVGFPDDLDLPVYNLEMIAEKCGVTDWNNCTPDQSTAVREFAKSLGIAAAPASKPLTIAEKIVAAYAGS
jgi:hypothetical protein